jgi:hypothetical protein
MGIETYAGHGLLRLGLAGDHKVHRREELTPTLAEVSTPTTND